MTGNDFPCRVKKRHQVGHAAVVDVGVRPGKAPVFRVRGEMRFHVLVDDLLQVDPDRPERADHHVRADAPVRRHVAAGVLQIDVSRVVEHGGADLGVGVFQHLAQLGGAFVFRRSLSVEVRTRQPDDQPRTVRAVFISLRCRAMRKSAKAAKEENRFSSSP